MRGGAKVACQAHNLVLWVQVPAAQLAVGGLGAVIIHSMFLYRIIEVVAEKAAVYCTGFESQPEGAKGQLVNDGCCRSSICARSIIASGSAHNSADTRPAAKGTPNV